MKTKSVKTVESVNTVESVKEPKTPLFKPQLVTSDENLLPYVIYRTKNYDLFKPFPYNRGIESGLKESKVKAYMALMQSDDFEPEVFQVLINKFRQTIDGSHRAEAARRLGFDVYFRILFDDIWQSPETALPAIAKINNINSMWSNPETYRTAMALNSELAINITCMISEASVKRIAVNKDSLTILQIFALFYRKGGHSKRIPLYDYFNEAFLAYSKTEQFEQEFDFCCYIVSRFTDSIIDLARIFEVVLPMLFKGQMDMEKFMRNSHRVKFDIGYNQKDKKSGIIKHIRSKVEEVLSYK